MWISLLFIIHFIFLTLFLKTAMLINVTDVNGHSLLHYAAHHSNFSLANFLANRNVDVTTRDHSSQTALHVACKDGSLDVVDLLLKMKGLWIVDVVLFVRYTHTYT